MKHLVLSGCLADVCERTMVEKASEAGGMCMLGEGIAGGKERLGYGAGDVSANQK